MSDESPLGRQTGGEFVASFREIISDPAGVLPDYAESCKRTRENSSSSKQVAVVRPPSLLRTVPAAPLGGLSLPHTLRLGMDRPHEAFRQPERIGKFAQISLAFRPGLVDRHQRSCIHFDGGLRGPDLVDDVRQAMIALALPQTGPGEPVLRVLSSTGSYLGGFYQ